jgi:hypothetical protein
VIRHVDEPILITDPVRWRWQNNRRFTQKQEMNTYILVYPRAKVHTFLASTDDEAVRQAEPVLKEMKALRGALHLSDEVPWSF